MMKIRVAVIGVGYLGRFHAEKYRQLPHACLVAVCDTHADAARTLAHTLQVQAVQDYRNLIGQVDAVSIAVPTVWHYEVALFFLQHGVHVLLEKPITESVEQATALIEIAEERSLVFQVGHLERFNPAVVWMMQRVSHFHSMPYIECRRLGSFTARSTDVSVVLDLMIHDLEILLQVVQAPIAHLDAGGVTVLSNHIDVATARIEFLNGCIAYVTASRVSPDVQRTWSLVAPLCSIHIDLNHKKITEHNKEQGIENHVLPARDVLQDEIHDFLDCIRQSKKPRVGGIEARRALQLAHEIQAMIHKKISGSPL